MIINFIKKIFGTAQSRTLAHYWQIVEKINTRYQELEDLNNEELQEKTAYLKQQYQNGSSLDTILPEAYAVVKMACKRLCGEEVHISGYDQKWDMVPYDVQLLGAIAMHKGSIAEMQTGEGKTLTAILPLYLNALSSKPVHLVTVNDYLAQRDCQWVGSVLRWLGMTTGALTSQLAPEERQAIYRCDVVYGTASEFGFDYLRDNSTCMHKDQQVQRGYFFSIVDEIDSILIDEARTPLIISGPVPSSRQMYAELKQGVSDLVKKQREFCSRLATEALNTFKSQKRLEKQTTSQISTSKQLNEQEQQAAKKLWLVSKGTPKNKILKKALENPDLRAAIDQWDLFYYSEQNKEEKAQALCELYITIDEKASEYELTDKGIHFWEENTQGHSNDFVMLDLSSEFIQIDQNSLLSSEEKLSQKASIQEEDAKRKERSHNLRQLLRAHLLMEKDVDYIVQDNKIVIIDENTGRPQAGRRFSDGLHQAIEAKESVRIQKETQTYATITLQNYFRMYERLAGMTGTAITEAHEFKEIYKLDVLQIPTHLSCQRKDANDEIYMTEREKYHAIIKDISAIHKKGRPILLGTESVEVSEKLSRILRQNSLNHTVLNAKNHAREAEIIAQAGQEGSITIATNMAGRGTDIKLAHKVAQLGGLHVIGTTRHQSRRIDRQLRGRCARDGDPGSSKFYISFEDSLMRLFAPPKMTQLLQKLRPPEGEPISAGILNRSIETAQKRIEARNYTIRKHTLEYDDVMNKQRQEIYSFRNEILHHSSIYQLAFEILEDLSYEIADQFLLSPLEEEQWKVKEYFQWFSSRFPVAIDCSLENSPQLEEKQDLVQIVCGAMIKALEQKIHYEEQKLHQLHQEGQPLEEKKQAVQEVMTTVMLQKIDQLWQEHLLVMDHLRSDVHMRTFAQKDPLMEFKEEAFSLFSDLSKNLRQEIALELFKFEILPAHPIKLESILEELHLETQRSFVDNIDDVAKEQKPKQDDSPMLNQASVKHARNEPCPCGSGKKYKKCCATKLLSK